MASSESVSERTPASPGPVSKSKGSGTVATLELLRGLASLDVFVWHLLNGNVGANFVPGLYRVVGWSRESVIIFFVLSGYVIALSQQRLHRAAGPFFLARIKRILPIYLIALAAALGAGYWAGEPSTVWQVVGHLCFLQSFDGSLVPTLATNGPLWSLGTEFEFYVTLTLILLARKPALIFIWWGVALAGLLLRHAGWIGTGAEGLLLEFLGLSPCWLIGHFFASLGAHRTLTLVQALTLFLMVPMVSYSDYGTQMASTGAFDDLKCFFQALLIAPLIHTLAVRQMEPAAKPEPRGWVIVLACYFAVSAWALLHPLIGFRPLPMLSFVLLPVAAASAGQLLLPQKTIWPIASGGFRRASLFAGSSSYALYAIHTPLMYVTILSIANINYRLAVLLGLVAATVVILEYQVQPRAARWIDGLFKPRPARA